MCGRERVKRTEFRLFVFRWIKQPSNAARVLRLFSRVEQRDRLDQNAYDNESSKYYAVT